MKRLSPSQVFGATLLALSLWLAAASVPAIAQNPTTDNVQRNNAPNLDTTPFQETRGQVDNYGWLGIFGLLGLLNLLRKPHTSTSRQPDVATRSGYRD